MADIIRNRWLIVMTMDCGCQLAWKFRGGKAHRVKLPLQLPPWRYGDTPLWWRRLWHG